MKLQGSGWDTTRNILGMAGLLDDPRWSSEGDVVYLVSDSSRKVQFPRNEVQELAFRLVKEAREWLKEFAPSLNSQLRDGEAALLHYYVFEKKAQVLRVKLGEPVRVEKGGSSYFGSGGAWGVWEIFGAPPKPKEEVVKEFDNGFAVDREVVVTFSAPGAIYSASGDSINGGRVFFRLLIIAE
jgi:hypothetical protein